MDYDRGGHWCTWDWGPQRVVTLLTPPSSIITSHITHRETNIIPRHNECLLVKKEAIDKEECLNCELCVSGKKAEIISAKCRKNNCKATDFDALPRNLRASDKSIFVCWEERCAGGWGCCQHLDSDLEWQIWTYLDRAEMICRFGSRPQHSHSKWTQSGWRR